MFLLEMAKDVVHRRQSICLTFSRPWVQFLLSRKGRKCQGEGMKSYCSLGARQGVGKGPGNEEFVFFLSGYVHGTCMCSYICTCGGKHIHVYLWRWIQDAFINGF